MEKSSMVSIIGIFCALLVSVPCMTAISQSNSSSLPNEPNVVYMNDEAVDAYQASMMNYSRLGEGVGNVTDIESALYGNNTYVALIASNSSENNNVYLQVSRVHNPTNFSSPVNLTNPFVNVNASNLGIAAFNNTYVYVMWQDTAQNGNNSIYTSDSKDSGQNFKTYNLSGDANAMDPKIITDGNNVFYTWLEVTNEGCTEGGSGNLTSSCTGAFAHGSGW